MGKMVYFPRNSLACSIARTNSVRENPLYDVGL